MEDFITYMGYEWIQVDDGVLTIGINDDGLEEFSEIISVGLPTENEEIEPDEVCGELETDQGPMNLYCPLEGHVVEINEAVVEKPSLIQEDPYGDGWLFKVELKNPEDAESLTRASTNDKDE